jgi:hypothetical protein
MIKHGEGNAVDEKLIIGYEALELLKDGPRLLIYTKTVRFDWKFLDAKSRQETIAAIDKAMEKAGNKIIQVG